MKESNRGNQLELEFGYAWNWFQYHASQRLTAFNFFLVLTSAAIVGYGTALDNDSPVFGAVVAFIGLVVAVGFLAMDIRNAELVQCGRAALDGVEGQLRGVRIRADDQNRTRLGEVLQDFPPERRLFAVVEGSEARQNWLTHGRWLRLIMVVVAVAFLAALGWAATGF